MFLVIKIVEKPWFLSGAVCLLLLLTAAAFLPCLTNGFTNWDDPDYLTNNPLVLSLSFQNLKEIFFSDYCPNRYLSPLVVFTFAVEHHFFGKSPLSYHTTNLALHLLNTLLTFWLIRRVSKNPWVGFLTALLFAVHPLRVESVAWITERKDVLCSFFFLTALLTYLNYQKTNRRSFYLASLLLFLLSLAVKPLAITFPLLLICFDFLGTKRPGKKTLYQKIPFFALSFLYGFLILRTQSRFFSETPVSALTPARHFFYGAYAILFYLAKLLVPVKLSCVYPIPKKTANLPLLYMAAPSLLLLLTAGLVALKKYSRIILFGSLFFFLTVLPAIQIIPVNASIVFDRYTYLPSIGFFYVIAEGICAILRSQRSRLLKQAVVLCVVIGVAGAVILTRQRCAIWDNDLALWTDAVSKYPNIALARLNRGNALCIRGKVSEAITDYDAAISLSRKYA
ncbi:MAG: hypothetical protein WCG06_04360, partial [Candidatus Omnitrophota bacterium]